MISAILSRIVILLFGTLYPAYASYKAVKTKNFKEYLKWMMYWIVFALFTCAETFTDVFLSWFPFYYEIKIILVIWLLSPATKGSSILYRKFVHPMLSSREQEIDEYIAKAKEQSYKQVLTFGSKGVQALMQTAIKGGGGLVNQLKKSYSLSDLSDPSRCPDETDDGMVAITDPRLVMHHHRRRQSPMRSSSSTSTGIYFAEVESDRILGAQIQSVEDISSGYSSGEYIAGQPPKILAREGLARTGSLTRTTRTTRVTRSAPKKSTGSDESDDNDVFDTNIIFLNDRARKIDEIRKSAPPAPASDSASESEFFDTVDSEFIVHDRLELRQDLSVLSSSNSVTSDSNLTACSPNQKINKLQEMRENRTEIRQNESEKIAENPSEKLESRGGKYNKKAAPPPPTIDTPSIKATLILKPGVVKNIGPKENSKEVFLNSPKSKRKERRSPSFSRKKIDFSNFLKLPKLPSFMTKEGSTGKRSSWHELMNSSRRLVDMRFQSKSENQLTQMEESAGAKSASSERINLRGSQVSIQSLTESPLARKRLKIIRKYVDHDID